MSSLSTPNANKPRYIMQRGCLVLVFLFMGVVTLHSLNNRATSTTPDVYGSGPLTAHLHRTLASELHTTEEESTHRRLQHTEQKTWFLKTEESLETEAGIIPTISCPLVSAWLV
jgi:hypothetical protein